MASPTGLERQLAASLRRAGFSSRSPTVVVAASGGPDSTALLRGLHRLRVEHRLRLHVAHLNHDFRGAEADHDAAFVQRLADGLGLPCSIDKQDPIAYQRQRNISSFEQAAREMRYAFLCQVASSVGACAVALGHTADDQAETVLMHLLRGSGLHGLRGMSEVARWPWPGDGPLLFRPLLGVGKTDTAEYCRALGQTYREDSGNYMWRFTRNKVRRDLLPRLARDYNPRVRDALLRLSSAASEDVDFVEKELDRHWPGIASEAPGSVALDVAALSSLHPSLRRHALRRAFSSVAGDARGLSESNLEHMLSLLEGPGKDRSIDLPRGVSARRQYHTLEVASLPGNLHVPGFTGEHSLKLPSARGELLDACVGGWRIVAEVIDRDERPGGQGGSGWPLCRSLWSAGPGRGGDRAHPAPRRPLPARRHGRHQEAAGLLHRRESPPRTARRRAAAGLPAGNRVGRRPPHRGVGGARRWLPGVMG